MDGCDGWQEFHSALARFLATLLARCSSNLCKPLSRDATAAELRSPRLCGSEGCFGPFRDGLGFLLSNGGQDVDHEPIRLGHIDSHELDAGFHKVRDEGDIAGKAIELSDHQRSAMLAAEFEGGGEGWTVVALSAFDFQDLLHQGPVSTIEESGNGGTLRFEAQASGGVPGLKSARLEMYQWMRENWIRRDMGRGKKYQPEQVVNCRGRLKWP